MRFTRDLSPRDGNCFVIMPFGRKQLASGENFDWDEHYTEVLAPFIHEAGMTPVRADDIFGTQPLLERVWRGIQEAEIVIADVTGRNPNVFYELGLAHAIWKRVVLLTMNADDVPSDLAHLAQVRYSIGGRGLVTMGRELKENLKAARSEDVSEAALIPLTGGDGAPDAAEAEIVSVFPDFAVVLAHDGRRAFLHPEDFSWARIPSDLTRHLRAGQTVRGAFVTKKGDQRYSLIANEPDPWPNLAAKYPIGAKFAGRITTHVSVGAFVEMAHGINGLIPESLIPVGERLDRGAEVEALTMRVDSARRVVELRLSRMLQSAPSVSVAVGDRCDGVVTKVDTSRGFALVAISTDLTALLHFTRMSEALRTRFQAGNVLLGERVFVQVVEVRDGRVQLSDLGSADEAQDSAVPVAE